MVIFLDSIPATLHKIKLNWKYLPLAFLFDIITLLFFKFGSSLLHDLSAIPLLSLVDITAIFTPTLLSFKTHVVKTFIEPASFSVINAATLIGLFLILITLFYGIFLLFNGPSWYLAHKMNEEPVNPLFEPKFLLKFSIISGTWFLAGFLIITFATNLAAELFMHPVSWISLVTLQRSLQGMNFAFLYFLFISFGLVSVDRFKHNFQKTFKYGIKNIFTFAMMYAFIAGILLIANGITSFIANVPDVLTISSFTLATARSLLVAPFLVFARIYLLVVVKKATK